MLDGRRPWRLEALVAERFRYGNVCIQDAHNLAWKLAAVLDGTAGSGLLDSYEPERRPVVDLTMTESFARGERLQSGRADGASGQPHSHSLHYSSVSIGYRYHSSAVLPEEGSDGSDGGELTEDPYHPSGRPGTRAAHVVVERSGQRLSTHDLFGPGFVLLAGSGGDAWCEAARQVAGQLRIELRAYRVRPGRAVPHVELLDVDGRWPDTYGVTSAGAVLVRPDGFIAWRSLAAASRPRKPPRGPDPPTVPPRGQRHG